jgi:hypothetical protein
MSKKKQRKNKQETMAAALKAAGLDPAKAAEVIQELAKRNFVVMVQPPYGIRKEPKLYRPPTLPRSWM